MAVFDVLLDTPAIPRILEFLAKQKEGCNEAAILGCLPDECCGVRALGMLIDKGIVTRKDGIVKLAETEENNRTVAGIVRFYQKLDTIARKRLLFRGILNSMQYACFVHFQTFFEMMQSEGFGREDVEEMIRKEIKEGYVEQVKIMYRTREELRAKHKAFPFVPLHYYPHFIIMKFENTDHLKERLRSAGIFMIEEHYLLGHYPKDIAKQSQDYILKEKPSIREAIKHESLDLWWYYRL